MATVDNVKSAYLGVNRTTISDSQAQAYAAAIDGGSLTLNDFIAQQIAGTTGKQVQAEVATYAFLTGNTPSSAQLDALASFAKTQSDYYSSKGYQTNLAPFEALGVAITTDATTKGAFVTKYGSLSNQDFISSIYIQVTGGTAPTFTGNPLGGETANGDHFLAQLNYYTGLYTKAGSTPADAALMARGAIAGQIIALPFIDSATAAKSNLDDQTVQFLTQAANGTAAYGAPLPPAAGAVGSTFTLTTGIDSGPAFVGTVNSDTFNAFSDSKNAPTLTSLDNIDGGSGIDTLNVAQGGGVAFTIPTDATVKNIEIANITGTGNINGSTVPFTGLVSLNVTSTGGTDVNGGTKGITAASTTAIKYTDAALGNGVVNINGGTSVTSTTTENATGLVTIGGTTAATGVVTLNNTVAGVDGTVGGAITVTGGTSINVTQTAGNAVNTKNSFGNVVVTGSALTTSVNVSETSQATATAKVVGVQDGNITINDLNAGSATKAGTISSVSVTSGSIVAISSPALNTLSLGGTITGVSLVEGGSTAATNTTLALNVNGLSGNPAGAPTLTDASNQFSTLNITTGAAASTLGNINDTALKTVNIAGAGGLTANLLNASITKIDASASTGATTVTLDPTKATYAGGSGVDTVTIALAPTKSLDGGAGTNDKLVVNIAGGFSASSNANIVNFETLGLGVNASGTYDALGFTHLAVDNALAGAVTFSNVAANIDLAFTSASTQVETIQLANSSGKADVLAISESGSTGIANSVVTTGIEILNLSGTQTGGGTTNIIHQLTVDDTSATTINVTSGALTGFKLIDTTSTLLTSVNASGVQGDGLGTAGSGFEFTTGALAATTTTTMTTITGSKFGGDKIDASNALDLVTITETAGTNTLLGSTANKSIITGGTGADTITGGTQADTIIGGGGADKITAGGGADQITISGTTTTLFQGIGDSGKNVATTTDVAILTGSFDIVRGAAAGDKIAITGDANIVTFTNATNLAGAGDDKAAYAYGTYDGNAGTFAYNAGGADTLVTYDSTGGAGITNESIVLVGFHVGATAAAAAGVITLA